MPIRPQTYHRPDTLANAWQALQKPDTHPLGGGTKLLAGHLPLTVSGVVDLQQLGLNQITMTEASLRVGATVHLADWAEFLREAADSSPAPLLQNGIRRSGPNTYRNGATVGGTIASHLPDSELLAALLVLETSVYLYNQKTAVALSDYVTTPEQSPHLITHITIPWQAGLGASERVARTPADYPIVSVTAWQTAEGEIRLAATGLAARPLRLRSAEAHLPQPLSAEAVNATAQATQAATVHPGDFRGDAAYRADMAAVLTRRVLAQVTK